MTKENYLKLLGELLREYYRDIKVTGVASSEREHFLNGYLTAARTLNAVYQKELDDYADKIHFEIFRMTIEERQKASGVRREISQDELDIPAYRRKGIKLKFWCSIAEPH